MKNNIIKKLAQKAKNRLQGKELSGIKDNACVRVVSDDDLEFKIRAQEVLIKSARQNLYNPIKMLIDENVLMKLDERGKEKYFFQIVDKYLEARSYWLNNQKV